MTEPTAPARSLAKTVTEASSPTVLAPTILLALAIDVQVEDGRSAIWWGLFAAVFVGVIPAAVLRVGAKLGRWQNHHVPEREQRWIPLAAAVASVGAGLAVLYAANAPREIAALIVAMLLGLLLVLLISAVWKVSIHAAVAGGTVVIAAIVFGGIGLVVAAVVAAAACWSRIVLSEHSRLQVLAGLAVGSAAAMTYLPLS